MSVQKKKELPPKPDLRRLIADNFTLEAIAELCKTMGINPQEIPGDTPSAKAVNLIRFTQRRRQADLLLAAIDVQSAELDMSPYLYLLIGAYLGQPQNRIMAFCEALNGIDCPQLLMHDLGFFTPAPNLSGAIQDQAWALQLYMEENGRYAELVHALQKEEPGLNLRPFQQ